MRSEDKIARMYAVFGKGEGLCKDCSHRLSIYTHCKHFNKCEVYGNSASEATDWKVNQQACGAFNKDVPNREVYKAFAHARHVVVDNEQMPGQMEMEL